MVNSPQARPIAPGFCIYRHCIFINFKSINMPYQRVIPRDFFNEAKLLKCMGRLSLMIVDKKLPEGLNITIEPMDDALTYFSIDQDESDGSIFVTNYTVMINGIFVILSTKLNSTRPYPLYCFFPKTGTDEIEVFDDNGQFTDEFCNLKNKL